MSNPNRPPRSAPHKTPTAEDIIRYYNAAMDSVNLINQLLTAAPPGLSSDDVTNIIKRNVDHLKIVVTKPFWTTEDLTPFQTAIVVGTPAE